MSKVDADGQQVSFPEFEFSPFDLGPVLSHVEAIDELGKQCPFMKSTFGPGFWVVADGDLVKRALQQPHLFSSTVVTPLDPDPPYRWIPEMLDPPEHTMWRQFLAPEFSPGAMERLEDRVRQRCVEIIEPLVERGSCDFLRDFAWRYPTTIFMELMGLPVEGLEQFMHWEHEILHLPYDQDPDRSRAGAASEAVMGYFAELIEQRRAEPRDDLLTTSLTWRHDGEPIPMEDLLSFCLLMFMAGLDTVSIQLSYAFHHLATHDDDRRRLVAEPALIPSAVEEFLRAYAFVAPSRKVMEDTDFHGMPLKAGEIVLLPLSAATRDAGHFPEPETVVLDRENNNHIAFGAGPHRCVGSHLARRELRIALEEWHRRIPDYRLTPGVEVIEHGGMYGIDALGLTWS